MKFFFVLALLVVHTNAQNEDITCSASFCEVSEELLTMIPLYHAFLFIQDYLDENTCPTLSVSCQEQNSTHNGLTVLYPDFCNCCDYCLTNIRKLKKTPSLLDLHPFSRGR